MARLAQLPVQHHTTAQACDVREHGQACAARVLETLANAPCARAGGNSKARRPASLLCATQGSGVISVVVFGLWGNYTSKWGMLAHTEESGSFDACERERRGAALCRRHGCRCGLWQIHLQALRCVAEAWHQSAVWHTIEPSAG